jgi:hypothetical protein
METTNETPKKTSKVSSIKKVLDSFVSSIDVNQDYSLDDLKKLLSSAYKTSGKAKKSSDEKREPSKYNLFVKQEMIRLKAEHSDKSNPEIMSMAAALWREKGKNAECNTAKDVANVNDEPVA